MVYKQSQDMHVKHTQILECKVTILVKADSFDLYIFF